LPPRLNGDIEATVAVKGSGKPFRRLAAPELPQCLTRHEFERSQRPLALLRGPLQLLGNKLPGFMVTSAVREVTANVVQNNVQVGGCPLIEFFALQSSDKKECGRQREQHSGISAPAVIR
jgi:hypothetical protein